MMAKEQQLAQAAPIKNTIDLNAGASSGARDYMIVAGEKRQIQGARIVTYLDDPSWDFSKLVHPDPNGHYIHPRKLKGQELNDLAGVQQVVDMVVIHSDITATSRDCFRVLKMRGYSTHFMIDWDGTIYQGTDVMKMATHAASDLRESVNNFSVGIDFNCLLTNLISSKKADDGTAGVASQVASGGVRRISAETEVNGVKWKGLGYTDLQYDALIRLLRELNVHFPKFKLACPMDDRGEPIWQMIEAIDTEKMGIYGHYHLTATKIDPGPGMDWARLIQGLQKESNELPIELQKGVTIASLLTEDKVKQLTDVYYKNTEKNENGGFYPIGLGGQWHGGIHLHAPKGTEVRAMLDGVVVAARNGATPELGSNNFVLLRHDVPFDPKDDKKVFTFYSLYMHLLRFDSDLDKTDAEFKGKGAGAGAAKDDQASWEMAPEWVTNARRGNTGKPSEEDEAAKAIKVENKAPKTDPAKKKAESAKDAAKNAKEKDKAASAAKAEKKKHEEEAEENGEKEDVKPFLDVEKHLAALKRGDVALFAADGSDQTKVPAGKAIGRMGNFGEETGPDGVLHVEIFADGRWRQVVDLLGTHSEYWIELESDTDDNLMVDSTDLLRLVTPDTASHARRKADSFLTSTRRVDSEDIHGFFNGDMGDDFARATLRKAITRHVSEWSDQVDWFKSMSAAQGWPDRVTEMTKLLQDDQGRWRKTLFSQEISKQLPFIWLNEAVAKHIGLDTGASWDGLLYHFHPVHFLMWLTFHTNTRVRVLAKGKDKKGLMKAREKELAADAARKARGELPEDDDHGLPPELDAGSEISDPTEVLQELWDVPLQPGEWQRKGGSDE